MFIIKSLKKTSAMRRLMILMNEPYGNSYKEMTEHSNKIGYEFERLYLSMKEIPALSELLDKYNIDAEEDLFHIEFFALDIIVIKIEISCQFL